MKSLVVVAFALVAIAAAASGCGADEVQTPASANLPSLTTAECAYFGAMGGFLDDAGDTLGKMNGLFLDAAENPVLIIDQEWIISMAAQLAAQRILYDRVNTLQPPTSLAGIHEQNLSGFSKMNDATTLFAAGIDNIDPDALDRGTKLNIAAAEDLTTGTRLTAEFNRKHAVGC